MLATQLSFSRRVNILTQQLVGKLADFFLFFWCIYLVSDFFVIGPGGNQHDQPSAILVHDDDNGGDDESVDDEELPSSRGSKASKMSKPSITKKLDKEELPTTGNGQVYETKRMNEIKKRSKITSQQDDDDDDGTGEITAQSEAEDGETLPNQQKSSEKHGKRLKPKKRKVSA